MKIVALDGYACTAEDLSFDRFRDFGEVTVYDKTEPADIIARIGDAEAVITNKCPITEEVLTACSHVRYIGVTATGYNIIDIPACERHGVTVCNVPAYSTKAVAQQVFAYILYVYNKVQRHDERVKRGEWSACPHFCFYEPGLHELDGKTIGLIGFGNIAKQVAKLAAAFDMQVLVHTRTIRQADQQAFPQVRFVGLEELFRASDIVSVHCPLTEQTNGLVNRQTLGWMKPSAMLINTARGPVVQEDALADALNSGRLAYACVDVVSVEPIRAGNLLLTAKNILITPHTAWAPVETRKRLLDVVYDNLKGYLNGQIQNNITQIKGEGRP